MPQANSLRTYRGAVAIVTGGASGIGRALGEALARRGARVVLADRQIDVAREVAAGVVAAGGHASAAEVDVTDFAATERLIKSTFESEGRLDYLFNNAGVGVVGEARSYELDDWARVLDVNLRGVIHGVQAAYPIMLRQGFGHIVNTASAAGLFPSPLVVSYVAAKHAVVGLSTALRIEAAAASVRVSVLCPGAVRTRALEDGGKFGKWMLPIGPDALKRMIELQHPITPGRLAESALRAVARNRSIIVIPWWTRTLWWLNRLSPAFGQWLGRVAFAAVKRKMELPAGADRRT
jgi:NAD(P)-dependent dehydrogenase (short-subunit alcohol dehydrogenase family)